MLLLVLSIAWVTLIAGMLLRAVRQYRHYEILKPGREPVRAPAPSVTVIVPARNEAQNIARCLAGLLAQDYPAAALSRIVVDDNSEDATIAIVQEVAGHNAGLRLLNAGPLPPGWLGKPHACGVAAAAGAQSDWLCFIDADTVAYPPLLYTAVQAAVARGADMLSLEPYQELITPWERLILPAGFFLLAFAQDLRRTSDPSVPDASVNGQFLLVRRSVYEAAGGHAAVRDRADEDSALAVAMKRAGGRVVVLGTEGLLHTRMYVGLRPLWNGAARQAATLLRGNAALVGAAVAALTIAVLSLALPLWAFASMASAGDAVSLWALTLAVAGTLSLAGTHVGAARYFKIPWWYGVLFPVAYALGAGVLIFALIERWRGQVHWKGRAYSGVPDASA